MPDAEGCVCDLIDVTTLGGAPEYIRGWSNGCTVHPATTCEREAIAAQAVRDAWLEAQQAPLTAALTELEAIQEPARQAAQQRARKR